MSPENDSPSLVRFENVSKKYGHFQALRDISFEVGEGEIVGFLGPNGAGKTTAMRILSGFFPPTSGRVKIHGIDLFKHAKKAKQELGYLPEAVRFYPDMRVREYLRYVARLKRIPSRELTEHVQSKMALCGLFEVAHRLIGRLSKGYRQRVGIAQALIGDPSVLLLDEPTTGLDPQQITEIRDLIRALGRHRAVIFSTHILSEVALLCNRVIMINRGQIIAAGTVEELTACLENREGIQIKIRDKKDQTLAVRLLEALPGVEQLKAGEDSHGELLITFETSQNEDLRSRITKLFVQHGIELLEIQRSQLSLEDIFLGLLKRGKPNSLLLKDSKVNWTSPNANQFPQRGNWGNPDYPQGKENKSQDSPGNLSGKENRSQGKLGGARA